MQSIMPNDRPRSNCRKMNITSTFHLHFIANSTEGGNFILLLRTAHLTRSRRCERPLTKMLFICTHSQNRIINQQEDLYTTPIKLTVTIKPIILNESASSLPTSVNEFITPGNAILKQASLLFCCYNMNRPQESLTLIKNNI